MRRLNRLRAFPGTVIGLDHRTKWVMVADVCNTIELENRELPLRPLDPWMVQDRPLSEPRSVAEHYLIPKRLTPFGMGRVFGTAPYPFSTGLDDPVVGSYSGRPTGFLNQPISRPPYVNKRKRQEQARRMWPELCARRPLSALEKLWL